MKTGRNDPCPCGSGRKFKKCCNDEQRARFLSKAHEVYSEAVAAEAQARKLVAKASITGSPREELIAHVSLDQVVSTQARVVNALAQFLVISNPKT